MSVNLEDGPYFIRVVASSVGGVGDICSYLVVNRNETREA